MIERNYFALVREYSSLGGFESWAMHASPEDLMAFAEKLSDGRCSFVGRRPRRRKVTAFRIIRTTNVSSGFPLYLFLILCVKAKNMKDVFAYKNADVENADSGMYHVDAYGHLTPKPMRHNGI